MTFNITPPNITNLFGNWLVGVAKKDKAKKFELAYVLYFGPTYSEATEKREVLDTGCDRLELVLRFLHNQSNRRFELRLTC
jgi:hypothetical protein